ncbi:hypothetical protein IC582_017595 [Cucumis melo]
MERNGEGAPGASSSSSSSQITRPRRSVDPLLVTCRFFSIFDGIFRCYAVVITFFVVLAETEWEFIFKNWKVFLRLNPKSSIVLIYDYSKYLLINRWLELRIELCFNLIETVKN